MGDEEEEPVQPAGTPGMELHHPPRVHQESTQPQGIVGRPPSSSRDSGHVPEVHELRFHRDILEPGATGMGAQGEERHVAVQGIVMARNVHQGAGEVDAHLPRHVAAAPLGTRPHESAVGGPGQLQGPP